jgi:hypothetical protein
LPITSILGISLLGMRARQRVPLVKSDGSIGGVWLDAVCADAGRSRRVDEASVSRPEMHSFVEREPVHEQASFPAETEEKVVLFRPAQPGRRSLGAWQPGGSDDPDPGPTAA